MRSGTTFVLAVLGWVLLAVAIALVIGRAIREGERRDLQSLRRFEHRPFRKAPPA